MQESEPNPKTEGPSPEAAMEELKKAWKEMNEAREKNKSLKQAEKGPDTSKHALENTHSFRVTFEDALAALEEMKQASSKE